MGNENEDPMEKKRVQIIAPAYYSRKDVQEAIYTFCKNRETVPRYFEGFGKRPDILDYPSDVLALANKGATSFHCSQEIWNSPLDIVTGMTTDQYNKIRTGWDFLIDIDAKFFDYAKIAAIALIKMLEHHGVKNIGIKYSGSKGFHILIPSRAFPEELFGEKTKNMFPEWPRAIAGYLKEMTAEKINNDIINMTGREKLKEKGELVQEHSCPNCKTPTIEKEVSNYKCGSCKTEVTSMKSNRQILRCPNCQYNMDKVGSKKINFCEKCKINTAQISASRSKFGDREVQNTKRFEVTETTKSQADSVDIVLVSPRHLFRAPYSLHEKTCLASIVISKEELENFKPVDADPMKMKIKEYNPKCEKDEARELLTQALDWAKKKNKPTNEKKFDGKGVDVKGLKITDDIFPEVIQKIMQGMKQDGRKRALSVLLSFFSSLELPREYVEEKIEEWNKKNFKPLMEGYIKSQIDWAMRNKRLPPNYDKPIYKELGVLSETHGLKNPINYTIKEAMRRGFSNNNDNKSAKH
jgi:hypothetical protein